MSSDAAAKQPPSGIFLDPRIRICGSSDLRKRLAEAKS
jgi:hypothetical protein